MQRKTNGDCDAGAYHGRGQAAQCIRNRALSLADGDDHLVEKANVELLTDGVQDRAYQQCAEQTLSHGTERVDAVAFGGQNNVLALEEIFEFTHFSHPFIRMSNLVSILYY